MRRSDTGDLVVEERRLLTAQTVETFYDWGTAPTAPATSAA